MNINEKVLDQIIWGKRDFNATKAKSTNEREATEEKNKAKKTEIFYSSQFSFLLFWLLISFLF